ncbi:hypothetical protein SF23_03280, partial [Streptomyces sp. MBRL 10]
MTRDIRILRTGALLELSRRLRTVNEESVRASFHRRIRRPPSRSATTCSGRSGTCRSRARAAAAA